MLAPLALVLGVNSASAGVVEQQWSTLFGGVARQFREQLSLVLVVFLGRDRVRFAKFRQLLELV